MTSGGSLGFTAKVALENTKILRTTRYSEVAVVFERSSTSVAVGLLMLVSEDRCIATIHLRETTKKNGFGWFAGHRFFFSIASLLFFFQKVFVKFIFGD